MPDIATIWNVADGVGDWALQTPVLDILVDETGASLVDEVGAPLLGSSSVFTPGYGVLQGGDLVTAALISLFSDATAAPDDVIPDNSGDPRGWWGDFDQAVPVGSRLWLRAREKQTPQLLDTVQKDITDALQWFIDDGVVSSISVAVSYPALGFLGAQIAFLRDGKPLASLQFQWAWQELS